MKINLINFNLTRKNNEKIIAMLSVVLFSFGVAKAGELTITGSAKVYAITSADGASEQIDQTKV